MSRWRRRAGRYGGITTEMQIDDISKLPERYQKQIMAKIAERERTKPGKYRNVKTESNGIKFDSKKEAKRYLELMARREAGEIDDLRLQVNFTLQEAFTKPNGERVQAIVYKADFTYRKRDENGDYTLYIVEDVKSKPTKTRAYEIKKKLMREKFRIEVQEV